MMKHALKLLAVFLLTTPTALYAAAVTPLTAGRIPFPDALDAAAVEQDRLDDINRRALVLGNGDLSGLLWERNGVLCLRVTKNDVWDARVDTSQDPPMLQVDIPNQKWKGGSSSPPSYAKPYPQPRCAAIIRLGAPAQSGVWQNIRAQGKANEWRRQGEAGLMVVEGAGTVSAGYRFKLPSALEASFTTLKFRISGNAQAQYYLNIYNGQDEEVVATGWTDSPSEDWSQSGAYVNNLFAGKITTGASVIAQDSSPAGAFNGHQRHPCRQGRGQPVLKQHLHR